MVQLKNTIYQTDDHVIITEPTFNKPTEGIGNFLFHHMQQHKNKTAQIQVETGEEVTYQQLLEWSTKLAIYLKPKLAPDDIISLCSDNHQHASVPFIASQFIGAKIASLHPALCTYEMKHLLNIVKPRIIFTIPKSLQMIQDVLKASKLNTEIIVFGETNNYENYFNIVRSTSSETQFEPVDIKDLHQTAIIYFSSGSSGMPKGICLSHYAMLTQYFNNCHVDNVDFNYQKQCASRISMPLCYMSYTLMYWISAGQILLAATAGGNCRLLCQEFDAKEAWNVIVKYKPFFLLLTPVYALEMMCVKRPKLDDLKSLLVLVLTGCKISLEKVLQLRALLPDCDIYQGYGQTEMSSGITTFKAQETLHRQFIVQKPNSVGMPIKGMHCRIVDIETNTNLGPNQPGELLVKSDAMMNGYYNINSCKSFTDNGWMRTGDMLYYDEDFCFYFVERLQETFQCRGWFIVPAVLEGFLLEHEAVRYAAVIGIPKEDGHHAMGIVVLKKGFGGVQAKEIEKFVEGKVPERQRLRAGVKIVDSLPISVTGKIRKGEIAKMFKNI